MEGIIWKNQSNVILNGVKRLFGDFRSKDMHVTCGGNGESIPIHSFLLRLVHPNVEGLIGKCESIPVEVMEAIVELVYTGRVKVISPNVQADEILDALEFLGLRQEMVLEKFTLPEVNNARLPLRHKRSIPTELRVLEGREGFEVHVDWVPKPGVIEMVENRFQCLFCRTLKSSEADVLDHYRTFHCFEPLQEPSYICKICGTDFHEHEKLLEHIRTYHPHTGMEHQPWNRPTRTRELDGTNRSDSAALNPPTPHCGSSSQSSAGQSGPQFMPSGLNLSTV